MSVHLKFDPTFDDYKNAQFLHLKSSTWLRINRFFAMIGNPIIGILLILLSVWLASLRISTPLMLFESAIGLYLVLYPLVFRRRLRRCYVRTRVGSGECTLNFSDELIAAEQAHAKSQIQWGAVSKFSEDTKSFLIYLAPAKFFYIPKRFCSDIQLTQLREMVARNITPTSK